MPAMAERLRDEWPAVLAVVVLIGAHAYFTVAGTDQAQPLGVPLLAALVVFILAEAGRRLV